MGARCEILENLKPFPQTYNFSSLYTSRSLREKNKTKPNSPSLTIRKPVLSAGTSCPSSPKPLSAKPRAFSNLSVRDLQTTPPIKPCEDTGPSPEVWEAPSGAGKSERGGFLVPRVQPAFFYSGHLWVSSSSGELVGPVPLLELVTSSLCSRVSALSGPSLLGGVAQPRAWTCSPGAGDGAGDSHDPAQSLRWGKRSAASCVLSRF